MISFVNLSWLLLLPLPLIIRKWLKPATEKQQAGLNVPFYAYLHQFQPTTYGQPNGKFWLAWLIWLCLLTAATGPLWLGKPMDVMRTGRDILMAIDISGSMQIPDMELNSQSVDRLTVVKQVAQQFIKDREGDRLGLILFGSRAYLQTPLTFDLETVRHMLLDATVGLAGTQTAIGDAIGMAVKHLRNFPKDDKVLILLTDGVNNEGVVSPVEAANVAASYGIRIYTVGLGANQVVVPGLLGPQMLSGSEYELDESTLKQIASITHGIYFRASNPEELQDVYAHLNKIEPRLGDKQVFRPKTPLYYWPLGIAFCLALAMLIYPLLPVGVLKQKEVS